MAITHTLGIQYAAGNSVNKSVQASSGQEISIDETIPDAQTDLAVAFAAVRAKIQMLIIVSDRALTLETNSGSAADDTFTLEAGKPIIWYSGIGIAITDLFSADITGLFVTNASGGNALLQIRALIDPT